MPHKPGCILIFTILASTLYYSIFESWFLNSYCEGYGCRDNISYSTWYNKVFDIDGWTVRAMDAGTILASTWYNKVCVQMYTKNNDQVRLISLTWSLFVVYIISGNKVNNFTGPGVWTK